MPPTASIINERRAEYGIPVTSAYAAPASMVATTSGRLGTCISVPRKATAPHANARCDPETATRCVRPRT